MLAGRTLHRRVGIPTVTALFLVGCAGGPDPIITNVTSSPTSTSESAPALGHVATAIPGVESCDVLPQQAASGLTADGLPPLRLPCLTPGPDIDLSALSGRPVLVNLWATWCKPCRDEMPLLQANYERYRTQVQFLGVDTQDATEPAAEFLADVGITYPQVVDLDGDLLNHLRIPGLPVTVVLDADGRIAGKHIGELDQASIDDLLAKVP